MSSAVVLSCKNCSTRNTCFSICPAIEALLPKPRSGGHWKEFTIDPAKIDLAIRHMVNKEFGGKKTRHLVNDNYEVE